jgi:hypothetical protein
MLERHSTAEVHPQPTLGLLNLCCEVVHPLAAKSASTSVVASENVSRLCQISPKGYSANPTGLKPVFCGCVIIPLLHCYSGVLVR